MNHWKRALGAIVASAVVALVWGCGGSGPSLPQSPSGTGKGALKLVVNFPQPLKGAAKSAATFSGVSQSHRTAARSRDVPGAGDGVPIGAQSVEVELTNPTTGADLVQPQIVAPAASGQSVSVQFPLLPVGPVHVIASAFADTNATPPALATATADTTISDGATQQLTILLKDTATGIGLTSTSLAIDLNAGQTSTSNTATIFDASENTLTGLPLIWTSSDNTVAVVSYDPNNPATVTIFGLKAGTTTIEVREPNTGLTADATLTVTGVLGIQLKTLAVGREPVGLAINSTTNRIYVASLGTNTVTVIDGSNDTIITTIPVGNGPQNVAVDEGRNLIYVTNFNSNSVSVIDGATNTVTGTIPVGTLPFGVAVNHSSGGYNVFVSNSGDNTVSVIDGMTEQVVATIPVGLGPLGVAADPNTGETFVANEFGPSVTVINNSDLTIPATIPVGTRPYYLAVEIIGGHVYVTNSGSGTVSVIDESTNAVTQAVQVGAQPLGITGSSTANLGFVVDRATNAVSEYNLQSGRLLNVVALSSGAYGIATAKGKLYVTNDQTPGVVTIATVTGGTGVR